MTNLFKCDYCGQISEKDNLLNFQIFRRSAAKKLGGKRVDCKDLCYPCYEKIFKTTEVNDG